MTLTREDAYRLLTEYTAKEALLKHALAVEAAMRAYARKFREDEEAWGIVGLLHDFDYEKYPSLEFHPMEGAKILRAKGYPEEWITAIQGHAEHTGVPRETLMAKTLFAVDELCGFITAVTYVRPNRRLAEVTVESVKKKLKDKRFAAQVRREDIQRGAEELGVELDEHVRFTIAAMQGIAGKLGLG
ncbi:MAG: HDIG domain-containing protein [Calditrichaceae bacterium]|nr:HDIG domain-containing protein [Calditrichia bacterium]NUQ44114.1 HDIG domain-containing protein [Calditrichaceae bacterium]